MPQTFPLESVGYNNLFGFPSINANTLTTNIPNINTENKIQHITSVQLRFSMGPVKCSS